jgi:low affinity Fe/Cu permease
MSNRTSSWLSRYVSAASGPWKAAICFFGVVAALMGMNAVAILCGWYTLSNRLVAYTALAAVGFFVSVLLQAYFSLTASRRDRADKK